MARDRDDEPMQGDRGRIDHADRSVERIVGEFRDIVSLLAESKRQDFKSQLLTAGFADGQPRGHNWARFDFSGEDLSDADFTRCILTGSQFVGCSLVGADFTDCDLRGARFDNADVRGARFVRAEMGEDALARAINVALATLELRRVSTYANFHLVSDSTGETLAGVLRAVAAQFDNLAPVEHSYFLVRNERVLRRALDEIERAPGIVLFILQNLELRSLLEIRCRELKCPCVAILDNPVTTVSRYLELEAGAPVTNGRRLDASYFRRIDALDFAMNNDDDRERVDVLGAEVVLIGGLRTSKSPTAVYLAHHGVKTACVTFARGRALASELLMPRAPLVVGLTCSAERLVELRRNQEPYGDTSASSDEAEIHAELSEAQTLFERAGWPVVDTTDCSIEEVGARVLSFLRERGAPAPPTIDD